MERSDAGIRSSETGLRGAQSPTWLIPQGADSSLRFFPGSAMARPLKRGSGRGGGVCLTFNDGLHVTLCRVNVV